MKSTLLIFFCLFSLLSTQALAETRMGFGAGWSYCDQTKCNEERPGGDLTIDTVQWQLEQRLTRDLYLQARADINFWMHESYGLHLKYVFPNAYSENRHVGFYLRGGIQYYEVDLDRLNFLTSREKEKYDGFSYSIGAGWQYYTARSWGFSAELFYTDLDHFQSYGTMLTLSYRFGNSRF